jgi:alpha-galactosidase
MKKHKINSILILSLPLLLLFSSCEKEVKIDGENITVEFNQLLHSRVIAKFNGKIIILSNFMPSEWVTVSGAAVADFPFKAEESAPFTDQIGEGIQYTITGETEGLKKTIAAKTYKAFPSAVIYAVSYTNTAGKDIAIDAWTNNQYRIDSNSETDTTKFWSYQSGSYENRPDWVLPLKSGFKQQNYMGMNAADYGGGTPVSDIWRKDAGIAVGHLEIVPKLVSIPVEMPDDKAALLSVHYEKPQVLKSGESLNTFLTFVSVHQGDYFAALNMHRQIMEKRGVTIDPPQETAYEQIWCAWGYERDFNVQQVLNTLPKVKELGFKWAVLDDGWQTAEGDWHLMKKKFPNGDKDMKKFVEAIHFQGLKAQLWWAPLAVDPGTDLIKDHPEYLLLNKDGSKQKISWWNAFYLCPALPEVQAFSKEQVKTFMQTWDYDGLKIDGQHLNAAPPCYNPAHHHKRPEEGFEKVPEFFKVIYETALAIKPDAVVEICPCGTACSFFNLPYMNQPVSSDPTSSWQIRTKGKTFKALMGPSTAYFGDHVELSDGKSDFASTVGIGGVIGTKFTWPVGVHMNRESGDVSLTPEKEKKWKKWVDIYEDKMLPKGQYMGGLYDIGFDLPETHAIARDDKMYYAFYAKEWAGDIELRGLGNSAYQVTDYVDQTDLGRVNGPQARLNVKFSQYLLIECTPIN